MFRESVTLIAAMTVLRKTPAGTSRLRMHPLRANQHGSGNPWLRICGILVIDGTLLHFVASFNEKSKAVTILQHAAKTPTSCIKIKDMWSDKARKKQVEASFPKPILRDAVVMQLTSCANGAG
jgi:hypothetical protein